MKKIYIAHSYGGLRSNYQAITHICRNLVKLGVMPISPVHAFSYLHDNIPEEHSKALEFCEELVEMCDELWLTGEWQKSDGCHREHNAALLELVPVYEVIGWNGGVPLFKDGRKPRWMKGRDNG